MSRGPVKLPPLERSAFVEFVAHRRVCERCRAVDIDKPATLAETCRMGALLVKDALQAVAADDRKIERNKHEREGRGRHV